MHDIDKQRGLSSSLALFVSLALFDRHGRNSSGMNLSLSPFSLYIYLHICIFIYVYILWIVGRVLRMLGIDDLRLHSWNSLRSLCDAMC